MTDILDTMRLAAETGHAAWREGYDEAKADLRRLLLVKGKDKQGLDLIQVYTETIAEFLGLEKP